MIFQIRQTIDIKKDNPVLEYKQGLDYGNNLAHEWLVFVEEDGALVDLASVAVTGYFLREDGVTVKVDGSVKNGACSVVFDRRCYLVEGAVKCAMVLTRGAEVVTSAKLRTNANQNITDQIIDTGDTIPTDIYDLLTQIDAMREATAATVAATVEANAAAQRANAGAERAEQLQIDASGLAGDSNKLGGKPPEYYLPAANFEWKLVGSAYTEALTVPKCSEVLLYLECQNGTVYSFAFSTILYKSFGNAYLPVNIHVRGGEVTVLCNKGTVRITDATMNGTNVLSTSKASIYVR